MPWGIYESRVATFPPHPGITDDLLFLIVGPRFRLACVTWCKVAPDYACVANQGTVSNAV